MINIVLDTTGSMSVMGKNSGAIYVVKSIQDYCEVHNIKTTLLKLDGSVIKDLININFSDKISLDNSVNFFNTILISDGLFESDKENIFDTSILLGIDANNSKLARLAHKVYENENIIAALEYMIYKNNINPNINEEEDDDEW